ncbi:MAG TPA: hypothetical protein VFW78_01380 [Bacteroidia bacterium]|nr:hypothetical protein [Bacteroidia bacterium]
METANRLTAAGNYTAACYEFERQAWLSTDNTTLANALMGKAGSLIMEGNYSEAYRTTGRFRYETLSDTTVIRCRHTAALAAYLASDYNSAIAEIQQLLFLVNDTSKTSSSLFILALSYNENREWLKADSVLQVMVRRSAVPKNMKDSLEEVLSQSYAPQRFPKLKNPDTAQKWSTFIPGAGHIYAGYVGEGLLNFSLTAASLGFIGYEIYVAYYITAFTIGSGIFQHFYFGGINRAAFLADKRNYRNLRDYNDPRRVQVLQMQELLYGEVR